MYCGAGLRPAAEALVAEFKKETGITVKCDYAGSEILLSKIKVGKKGDLFMPGDKHYVDQVEDIKMLDSRQRASYFIPVIMVKKGNPKGIKTLKDLTNEEVAVALGSPDACAIGRKSMKIFAKNNISTDDMNVKTHALTVTDLGTQIKMVEHVDAVIVWDATAALFPDSGEAVHIPNDQNIISTVEIGALSCSENLDAARRFLKFVGSEKGQKAFRDNNYSTELPKEKTPEETPDAE